MYKARIKTDAGKIFDFSYENGVVFDIAPLSGTDVSVTASQGFNQIGETVTGQSVAGIRRTISGVILYEATAKAMLSVLPAFTTGMLTVNDSYFCNFTVQKTPEIVRNKNGRLVFSMQIFCDTPFWLRSQEAAFTMNVYNALFSFPVKYNTHKFGETIESGYLDIKNDGDMSVPYTLEITSKGTSKNYGIINILTGEHIRFNDTLLSGETVIFKRSRGKITAIKTDGNQNYNIVGTIADDSTLFDMRTGSNMIRVIADEGESVLSAIISFYPAYMGVIA